MVAGKADAGAGRHAGHARGLCLEINRHAAATVNYYPSTLTSDCQAPAMVRTADRICAHKRLPLRRLRASSACLDPCPNAALCILSSTPHSHKLNGLQAGGHSIPRSSRFLEAARNGDHSASSHSQAQPDVQKESSNAERLQPAQRSAFHDTSTHTKYAVTSLHDSASQLSSCPAKARTAPWLCVACVCPSCTRLQAQGVLHTSVQLQRVMIRRPSGCSTSAAAAITQLAGFRWCRPMAPQSQTWRQLQLTAPCATAARWPLTCPRACPRT
jgi:hypothetical protein